MNTWDYFEREAKKNGRLVKCSQKIPKAVGKGFQQKLEYISYIASYLLASWNDHLLTFVLNNVHEKKSLIRMMMHLCATFVWL